MNVPRKGIMIITILFDELNDFDGHLMLTVGRDSLLRVRFNPSSLEEGAEEV